MTNPKCLQNHSWPNGSDYQSPPHTSCSCHVTCWCRLPGSPCHRLPAHSSLPIGGTDKKATGIKLDTGKVRTDLVPMRAHWEMCRVLTVGCDRYGANNWRKVVGWKWRYIGAGLRHVFQFMMGKRIDDEGPNPTNLHHLACAMCSFSFVLDNDLAISEGVTVPDGDAIPEALPKSEEGAFLSGRPTSAEAADMLTRVPVQFEGTGHLFQPVNEGAYGSSCVVCGAQASHPTHFPPTLSEVKKVQGG